MQMQQIIPTFGQIQSHHENDTIDDEEEILMEECDESEDEEFIPSESKKGHMLAVGHSRRQSKREGKAKLKKGNSKGTEGKAEESKAKSDGEQSLPYRRVRQYEAEKNPDSLNEMTRIGRYLMMVKDSRESTVFRLVQNTNEMKWKWAQTTEIESHWKRVEEICPSLAKWIGTQSIDLWMRGTLPLNYKGSFSTNEKKNNAKLVTGPKKKRGRPRKYPEPEKAQPTLMATITKPTRGRPPKGSHSTSQSAPPKPLVTFGKPITLNEHLQSLVDASIAQKTPRQRGGGRRTNNSMNVSFDEMHPSTSILPPAPCIPETSSAFQSPLTDSVPKRPKLEPSDFELPSNFHLDNTTSSAISSSPLPPKSIAQLRWAANHPCTSYSAHQPANQNSSFSHAKNDTQSSKETNGIAADIQPKEKKRTNFDEGKHEMMRNKEVDEGKKERPKGKPMMCEEEAVMQEEPTRVRVPIFTARTVPFEVDATPSLTEQFESIQVMDIYNALPQNDPRLKHDEDITSSAFISRIVDRFAIRQGKQKRRTAQLLFCGGPLSAIAVCPRAMREGREVIAIATFADETMLSVVKAEELGQDAFVQLWINDLKGNSSARLGCLLRLRDVQHVCSMVWCPRNEDDYIRYKKPFSQNITDAIKTSNTTCSSTADQSAANTPLGLLAIATSTGQLLIFSIPFDFSAILDKFNHDVSEEKPLVLETRPLFVFSLPPEWIPTISNDDEEPLSPRMKRKPSVDAQLIEEGKLQREEQTMSSIPLFGLQWNPFLDATHIAAISASGCVYVWDLSRPTQLTWKLHFDNWQSPPQSLCWMESDKICISFRQRLIRFYQLLPSSGPDPFGTALPLMECDLHRTCGALCCSQPLVFPGLISYDSTSFIHFGKPQQASSYIWLSNEPGEEEQLCVTTLSNCHLIRNSHVSVCARTGLCASVGADGRLVCSLNGRMAPRRINAAHNESETFMHGRTLLQLIKHDEKNVSPSDEVEQKDFCALHGTCCANKWLEVRLGDCALVDQESERISRRRVPEVCADRRLDSLTVSDFSHYEPGLIYCGGDSGLVFIVPCTL